MKKKVIFGYCKDHLGKIYTSIAIQQENGAYHYVGQVLLGKEIA